MARVPKTSEHKRDGREIPLTPLYSEGTREMDGTENVGSPEGPMGREIVPDPMKYIDGQDPGDVKA